MIHGRIGGYLLKEAGYMGVDMVGEVRCRIDEAPDGTYVFVDDGHGT